MQQLRQANEVERAAEDDEPIHVGQATQFATVLMGVSVKTVRVICIGTFIGIVCGALLGASVPYIDSRYQLNNGVVRRSAVWLGAYFVAVFGAFAGAAGALFVAARVTDGVTSKRLTLEAAILGMTAGAALELAYAPAILSNWRVVVLTLLIGAVGGAAISWFGQKSVRA